jgi:biotin-(acetyl-CoA carboxylase) ligase
MTALLNDTELEALADKCQQLIANREQIKRNQLRQELMENLQKAIGDILHNNFYLVIGRRKQDPEYGYDDLWFDPTDQCTIEIE